MRTYYLISTVNASTEGWSVLEKGSKEVCENAYQQMQTGDIYKDTLIKNAKILCKSKAKRFLHKDDL